MVFNVTLIGSVTPIDVDLSGVSGASLSAKRFFSGQGITGIRIAATNDGGANYKLIFGVSVYVGGVLWKKISSFCKYGFVVNEEWTVATEL